MVLFHTIGVVNHHLQQLTKREREMCDTQRHLKSKEKQSKLYQFKVANEICAPSSHMVLPEHSR